MGNLKKNNNMKHLITFLISILTIGCFGQETDKVLLKISDFEFQSIFGMTLSDKKTTYCLLGSGFFRTPRSENSDSLINDWIIKHKNAIVIPVSSFGPTKIKDPDSKMIFCLVIQDGDTLNNYLIKNGCFPGGTMIRPKTWDEMEKWEKDLYEGTDEKSNVEVLMEKKDYDAFIEQIKISEIFARDRKLGIWKEQKDNENE